MDVEAPSGWSSVRRRAHDALWNDRAARPFASRVAIRFVRTLVVAALAFQDRILNLHAMGLVYATLLSLVPLLAVAVSVLKAFGAQYRLQPLLTRLLEPLGPQAADVTQRVVDFVSRMLASSLPSRVLREAELEELRRGAKLADVALEYLGLRTISVDGDGEMPLRVVGSHSPRDSWREALVLPEGDRPIGILINTADAGPLVLVHEVFDSFAEPEKELVRRYAALAVRGEPHEAIVAALRAGNVGEAGFTQALSAAHRTVRSLDPTVLFSPDGGTRVQLGSLSRTTKDILREGLQGDHLFIVPASLFEGKTNYADIEFLVYLNFFLRQKTRTRIVGTSRQRHVLHRLLTLTLFGLFDPAAPEPPSFEKLAEVYGVDSRETYDFLRTAHEAGDLEGGS